MVRIVKAAAVVIILAIVAAAAFALVTTDGELALIGARPTPTPASLLVRYEVWSPYGRGWAAVTYANASGGTEQLDKVDAGWTRELAVSAGTPLYLSAQNAYEAGGTGCRIYVDGVLFREAQSRGAYVIATCSGTP
jgi:hypothetical protein